MPQIILKERTAHLGSYTFFTRDWSILKRHFHSSINYQEEQLYRITLITGYFRPVNIAKFLRMGLFIEHLQKQSFADIPQNSRILKSFANFTGKHLCFHLFL